ncbi:MAG: hypothetical protein IKP05_00715 [Alphaproteobacteria bacterium]|nr:hypothetical protein [Alphaproteobacteria bacterium]
MKKQKIQNNSLKEVEEEYAQERKQNIWSDIDVVNNTLSDIDLNVGNFYNDTDEKLEELKKLLKSIYGLLWIGLILLGFMAFK